MAEHLKVHPFQASPSPKPSAPLVSTGSYPRSEYGDPERQQYYVRTAPPPRKRRCCTFKRCFCWTLALLILVVLVLGTLAAVVYFVYRPRLPDYSIDDLRITQYNLGSDNTLTATFNVDITATNPNTRIGIYYETGSNFRVLYTGTELCRGSLPEFYQGHRNTTVIRLTLTGETADAAGLMQRLQAQQQTGSVPLDLRGRVPLRLRLGNLRLTTWRFSVNCRLIVDSLSADNALRIRERNCRIRFRL